MNTPILVKGDDVRSGIKVNAHPRGVLSHMGPIGMWGPKGYGFSAIFRS